MYTASAESQVLSEVVRNIHNADNFGGNNRMDGYTNMVDMGGLIAAGERYAPSAGAVLSALEDAVAYNVTGNLHPNASGLSIYYPLEVQGSSEMSVFTDVCISPYYLSFVDRQNYGSVNSGNTDGYDDSSWFDDDGSWSWTGDYEIDEDSGWFEYSDEDYGWDEYWEYVDSFEQTGSSSLITFAVQPHVDGNGRYSFTFDQNGWDNAAYVKGIVYQVSYDGEDLIELGETADVIINPDTWFVQDYFDGAWMSLPDGQDLALYIEELTEDHVIYNSPITLNGEDTLLRIQQSIDRTITIIGAWDGLDDSGYADRNFIQLRPGDEIIPRYYAYGLYSDWEGEYVGNTYTVTEDMEIIYDFMEDGEYYYTFEIDDIFGDYYMADGVMAHIEDGKVTLYE